MSQLSWKTVEEEIKRLREVAMLEWSGEARGPCKRCDLWEGQEDTPFTKALEMNW